MGNYFTDWWASGYKEILPVIPPNATISPNSNINPSSAGKAPGVRRGDGMWGGYHGWQEHPATEDKLAEWFEMGASVGLRCGEAFLLDIDAYDAETADMIEAKAIAALGPAPMRVGQWPKRALLYRGDGLIPGTRLHFEQDGRQNQVEIPRQAVVFGIHARTGKPYEWPRKPKPLDQLTAVTPEQLASFFSDLRAVLPGAKHVDAVNKVDRSNVDQKSLEGDPELIAEAMRHIPNTKELFPQRADMIDVLMALSGALPNDRGLMADLAHDFCSRWEGGDYDYDRTEREIASFKPPHSVGADYIYWLAQKNGPFAANLWFQPSEDSGHIFDLPRSAEAEDRSGTYPLLTINELVSRPPPSWLIARHIPEVSVGFLYSEPGAGKTFLALDIALAIAANRPDWHGDTIAANNRPVIYIASEGSFGMRNRILAWLKDRNLQAPANFLMIERTINFMSGEDITKLIRTLRQQPHGNPALIVVDTVSRALPGADENLQKDMTLFVRACDTVRDQFHCAVLGVHHAGKSGDMRGSTVLRGAGDFVFRLTRKEGATIGHLACEKQKDGPDGWNEPYRFSTVGLDGDQASLVASRADISVGHAAVMTPDLSAVVLAEMAKAWGVGQPWSMAPQSKERYAVRRMVTDHGFTAEKAEDILSVWEGSGIIRKEVFSAKNRVTGFRVVGADIGQSVRSDDIFG